MNVKTESRILLSVLILGGMTPAFYAFSIGRYVIYGVLLILVGLGLLVWLWRPWRWLKSS